MKSPSSSQSLKERVSFRWRHVRQRINTTYFVEERIEQIKADIGALKEELEEAKQERNNKMEYDEVARRILALPARDETQKYPSDSRNGIPIHVWC